MSNYLQQHSCCLKIVHPHQTDREKQSCSQDYPELPEFLDKTVQVRKIQEWDNATAQPAPISPYPEDIQSRIVKCLILLEYNLADCIPKWRTTFPTFQFRNANATLKIYVLTAHNKMNTRSSPFNRCNRNKDGKANTT